MATRDDDEAPAGGSPPLLIEGPKAEGNADGPVIDLEPLAATMDRTADDAAKAKPSENSAPNHPSWALPLHAPLAAGIALAIAVGALAGAGATASLMRDHSPAALAASTENHALRDSVAQLGSELSSLKVSIAAAQRNSSTQFGKLAERLDRAEKAQAEPTATLAKIQESLDRLDRHQQQVAAAPAHTPAAAPAPDITGSVAGKEQSRPPLAEGWRMRDFHAGRAIVQSRNGTLFEVGPGSNLPGLGRVESVKRENGQVVVVAQNGTIAGSVAQRRPAYFLPYRY
jgi:hypothetical protein